MDMFPAPPPSSVQRLDFSVHFFGTNSPNRWLEVTRSEIKAGVLCLFNDNGLSAMIPLGAIQWVSVEPSLEVDA